jgi:hypothetical protein
LEKRDMQGAWRLRGRQHQASARALAEAPKAAAEGAEAKEETECAAREVRVPRRAVGRGHERPPDEAWAGQEAAGHGTVAQVENLRKGVR